MLSPSPLGDLALFGWRAVRLLREVAVIYGLRPGRSAEMRLLRRALGDGSLMAAADVISDVITSATGQVSGMILGRAAEAGPGAH
jgi:putative membrane protein